ncbi:MAG: phosphate ABC transporter permease PstA [Pseudomonadota bacterium]
MSNANNPLTSASSALWRSEQMQRRIAKRQVRDRRFKRLGLTAVLAAAAFIVVLLSVVITRAIPGLSQAQVSLEVYFDPLVIGATPDTAATVAGRTAIVYANYGQLIAEAINRRFADVSDPDKQRQLRTLMSPGARAALRRKVLKNSDLIGTKQSVWLYLSDDADFYLRQRARSVEPLPMTSLTTKAATWLNRLQDENLTRRSFHWLFFQRGDSREPELAGILGAVMGSFLTLTVTIAIAFPVGLASAIYLEEFAPKNRFVDIVEVNINNLAAIPSIIFGLLGLAVLLNVFHLPRSSPLVGGITLALMTLPTIIIAARAAITAVPHSLREAAMAIGASPIQVVFHHVVPCAMPGIMSGTIIGMAQALGETAPLLMIGMVAFVVDVPGGLSEAATTLPVQIFLWADNPERAFTEKTSAAILVLMLFLFAMNGLAVYLRNRFETRW